MPPGDLDALAARREEPHEGVWRQNVPAVLAFLAVASQWRVVAGGMGGIAVIGLDYTGVRCGLAAAGIRVTPAIWAGLQVMEAEAVRAMNGRAG